MNNKEIFTETNRDIFLEIETHLLFDDKPSDYLNELLNEEYLQESCFKILSELKTIPQNPKYHPEGDVWKHTMYVVDEAAKYKFKSNNIKAFMWAALLHDIGKLKTTLIDKNGHITVSHHDRVGGEMALRLLRDCNVPKNLRDSIVSLIKHHMTYSHVIRKTSTGTVLSLIDSGDINDVALLSLCDRLGTEGLPVDVKNSILSDINYFLDIMSQRTGTTNNINITLN